jgi:hypothetical protein
MKVLVATKSVKVIERLHAEPDVEIEPALFTDQIAKAIPSARLVIIDYEDVVEYPYSLGMIQGLLAEAHEKHKLPQATSAEFLADPEEFLRRMSRVIYREGELPDKLTVAFAAYSGGVGKTTLSMDMALHFARRTEQPVLLLEFVHGASALAALTGLEMPYLFDLVPNVDLKPAVFKGVTLIPMDYDNCRLMPAEQIGKYLKRQMANHVLTVVDTIWPHGLIESIQDEVDEWLVVTTPRLDAIENANKLVKELGAKASIVLNQKRGPVDRLALAGIERGLDLPYMERVDQWQGKLGAQLLLHVYGPAWRNYDKPKNIADAVGRYFARTRGAAAVPSTKRS